jgi:hypothetical protein
MSGCTISKLVKVRQSVCTYTEDVYRVMVNLQYTKFIYVSIADTVVNLFLS